MGEIVDQIPKEDINASQKHWLNKISAAAALITSLLLLIALIRLVVAHSAVSLIENNWLIILFKLNAGYAGFQFDRLQGVYLLDVALLILAGITYLGVAAVSQHSTRIWRIVAAALPFLGIGILITTKLAGRSAVMGGGLIIALIMLHSKVFDKGMALVGVIANVLLLIGDLGTNPITASTLFATVIAVGYVLLITWFFLIAGRLYKIR